VALEKGAALMLVSRGLVECEGHSDGALEDFGLGRIKQTFEASRSSTAQSLCSSVVNAAAEFGGKIPPCDDRTALALLRTA
jgi:hypothetical protein